MKPHFIRAGERFININAIVSFEVLPTGAGYLMLANSPQVTLQPKEARWLADYLTQFSEEFQPFREFPRGNYPVGPRMASAGLR